MKKETKKTKKPFLTFVLILLVVAVAATVFYFLHPHFFGEWETIKGATCTENGLKERVCFCGEKETGTISAKGHTFGEWIVDESATCMETGTKHRVCTVCGEKETETIPVDPTAHNYATEWTSDDENHWHVCQNDGCTSISDEEAHTFDEWVIDVVDSCMQAGVRHHVCTVCDKSVSENYADLSAHNYSTNWTSNNTHHWHVCLNTGCASIPDKTEHTFGEWIVDTAATCQKTGTRHHVCTVCNKSVSETYSAPTAHNYATTWTSDNTHHWHKCQNSGCTSVVNKTTHTFGEWIVDTAATCQKSGTRHHVCTTCNKSVSESYSDATAHNYATTWTSDNTNHWHKCQNSGCTSISDKATHTFGEWIVDTAATCQKTGTRHHLCTVCNKSVIENYSDPSAHNYATTWTSDDTNHWHACQNSGCSSVSGKTTHTFGEWIVDTAATCQKPGTRHHVCTTCSKSVSETIFVPHNYATIWANDNTRHWHECQNSGCTSVSNKTTHTFGNWIIDEAATCQKAGTHHHICTVCNKSVSETYSDATAHKYSSTWTTDDTHHWHKCQNSGCASVSNKANHNMKDGCCTVCNYAFTYTRVGNYIYFGEYPQTLKAESVTITTTKDTRGYYLGSDGFYYAKVMATPYLSSRYTFSTGAAVSSYIDYYFKVEPIRWRILSESGDTALILCDSIIANKNFTDYYYDGSNYAKSEIRAWLNDQFYNIAFSSLQKELINTVLVDNSVASTGDSSNRYACEDTNDKIFLLSYKEATNSAYGFASSGSTSDAARRMTVSDYARATGAYIDTSSSYYGNGYWWLRSPWYKFENYAYGVRSSGSRSQPSVFNDEGGVVPALQIRLR